MKNGISTSARYRKIIDGLFRMQFVQYEELTIFPRAVEGSVSSEDGLGPKKRAEDGGFCARRKAREETWERAGE